jgi:predicted enzyme related to lactoylglutathione lyase
MVLKRLDRLEVATSDSREAAETYQSNFGFKQVRAGDGFVTLAVGDAEICLKSGASVEGILNGAGEGMAALYLEAEDVEVVAVALKNAGVSFGPIRKIEGRRVIAVDPSSANQVPLYIFDRRP